MLQIVTKRRNKLKKLCKITCLAVIYGLLSACGTTNQPANIAPQKTEKTHQIQIEPQKGRISPEISVARSLKYNTDSIKQQTTTKFIGEEAYINAFKKTQRKLSKQHFHLIKRTWFQYTLCFCQLLQTQQYHWIYI